MHKQAVLILTILLAALAMGCGIVPATPGGSDSLQSLAAAEVREYNGKDLSSILDFRENSIAGAQYVEIGSYRLTVDGLVETPTDFTYDEVLRFTNYSKVVTLNCVEGWSVDILWEGVRLADLFAAVVVDSGANTVIFQSADGYTTSLPLTVVLDRDMILAAKMNGIVLPPQRGYPFQLVAEDKLGYKWAKWITRIELSDDAAYKGYWESRGYGNEAESGG